MVSLKSRKFRKILYREVSRWFDSSIALYRNIWFSRKINEIRSIISSNKD